MTQAWKKCMGRAAEEGLRCAPGEPASNIFCARMGQSIGITDLKFRLLPVPVRLKTGLELGWFDGQDW